MVETGEAYDIKFLRQTTAIKTQANAGATVIDVDSTTGMAAEQAISIVLDDASTHWDIITLIFSPDTLDIQSGIPAGRYAPVDAVVKTYYAYMLRQHGEVKDWTVNDAPLLPQTILTGSASPSTLDPEREIQISQTDWRKGFQDFILEDEHKYYDSIGCDARYKGEVIISPIKLTAISLPAAPYLRYVQNNDFEEWSDAGTAVGWTEVGSDLAQSGTSYTGTYAARLRGFSAVEEICKDLPFNLADVGQTFSLTVYCKVTSGAAGCYIGIDDGIGTTWSAAITGTTYAPITVSRALDASANRLRVRIQIGNNGTDLLYLYADSVAINRTTGHLGACTKIIEFGNNLIFACGQALLKLTSGALSLIYEFGEITDLCVFKNRLYIAQGWNDEYFYSDIDSLGNFTECTLSGSTAKYMSNIGNTQFWIADTATTVTDSGNPINGGTGFVVPSYKICSDYWAITGLVDHDEIVFVRTQDDVYYLSEDVVYSLMHLSTEATASYSHGLHLWGERLYIPSGINSLYEYDIATGIATTLSLTKYAPGDINYDGQVRALCHDGTYLYCAIPDPDALVVPGSIILAGRWEEVDGDTDWYWHPIIAKNYAYIGAMLISSLSGAKRLYIGTDAYTDGIIPFMVSITYSATYRETGMQFDVGGFFYTPWLTSNFPTEQKHWKSIDVTSICITDKTSIYVWYQIKGQTSWTELGYCTKGALSGGAYPVETTDTFNIGVSSERIRFQFILDTDNVDYTPVLYGTGGGYIVRSVLQTERKRQITATIDVAPQIRERNGGVLTRTVATDLTNLRALYTANAGQTVTGPDGTIYNTVFAREGYEEQLAYGPAGGDMNLVKIEEWWVTIKLLEA